MFGRDRTLHPDDRVFFTRWLRNPFRAGALVPSGPWLARLMAEQVDPARPGVVVELGGGTGRITAALLNAGVEPGRLLVIEQDEQLYEILDERFPESDVVCGDAGHLSDLLSARGIERVNAVVSGLPLLLMPRREQRDILGQAFARMDAGGVFAQFTYGPNCPVPQSLQRELGLTASAAGKTWLNIPPATVWRFSPV